MAQETSRVHNLLFFPRSISSHFVSTGDISSFIYFYTRAKCLSRGLYYKREGTMGVRMTPEMSVSVRRAVWRPLLFSAVVRAPRARARRQGRTRASGSVVESSFKNNGVIYFQLSHGSVRLSSILKAIGQIRS